MWIGCRSADVRMGIRRMGRQWAGEKFSISRETCIANFIAKLSIDLWGVNDRIKVNDNDDDDGTDR